MHICFVEGYYPRDSGLIGGAGIYVQTIGRELTYLGHEVSVICAKMDDNRITYFKDGLIHVYPIIDYKPSILIYYISRVPIIKIFSGFLFYLHNGLKIYLFLLKLNRKIKIDLIEYTEGGDFWNAIFKKYNYIVHLHGSAYTVKKAFGQPVFLHDWYKRVAEHFFIKRANQIVTPSHAMKQLVETEMGNKLKNIIVIPYPVSDQTNLTEYNCNRLKEHGNKIILIFVSRNDPVKGGELLINALKRLSGSIKEKIQVNIYGYKPKYDISKITFLTVYNFISRDELNIVYKNADICIIPSLFDNSPNTVYEAMSHAKIIVASSVGGIPEIIGDQKNGFLFEPNNVQDLVNKLTDAIELVLSGEHIKMGEKVRQRIISYAGLQKNVEKRIALYSI